MSSWRSFSWAVVALSVSATACVSESKYDEAVRDATAARAELARLKSERDRGSASMQKDLAEQAAVQAEISKQLAGLGQSAESLLAAQTAIRNAIDRAAGLRLERAAAESRAALYRDLALKLQRMIGAGTLAIALHQGRMVLRLQNDVLFDSGSAQLKAEGEAALSQLATVLAGVKGRRFQVCGHTDDEPIKLTKFKSNWELSTARALEVTSFLIGKGLDPHALSATGYGEFDPLAGNETAAGKARNRRTEIVLQPNVDELVAVP